MYHRCSSQVFSNSNNFRFVQPENTYSCSCNIGFYPKTVENNNEKISKAEKQHFLHSLNSF